MAPFNDGREAPSSARSSTSAVGVAGVHHDALRDLLSDYLDGSLPEAEQRQVEEHLARCPDCQAFCATLRATIDAVSGLPRAAAPRSARQRLLDLARSVAQSPTP